MLVKEIFVKFCEVCNLCIYKSLQSFCGGNRPKNFAAPIIFPVFSGEAALPERFFVWPAELLEPAKFLF